MCRSTHFLVWIYGVVTAVAGRGRKEPTATLRGKTQHGLMHVLLLLSEPLDFC